MTSPPADRPALHQSIPFSLGDLLADKYRVERILGVGGMGVVLAARHLDLDRMVAVKVIRRELANDDDNVQRLLLEARNAAKIRSDHVGKVLDMGRLPSGEPYIVMEYLDGYDLAQYLERKGKLETSEAVDLLLQACEAIVEAHDSHIVHRDLKPENLFLVPLNDGSHFVKVLDFGISKHLGEKRERALTTPQTAVGSPQYMAPEQMQAEDIDFRVDVWALGAILYEMLAGSPAFDGDTLPAVCARVLSATPTPIREWRPEVAPGIERCIQACLEKDRRRRLPDVRALVRALAGYGGPQAQLLQRRILGQAHAETQRLDATDGPVAARSAVTPTVDVEPTPASRTVTVNRSSSRTPIFAVMGGIVVVGVFLFWLVRGTPMHTRPPDPANTLAPGNVSATARPAQAVSDTEGTVTLAAQPATSALASTSVAPLLASSSPGPAETAPNATLLSSAGLPVAASATTPLRAKAPVVPKAPPAKSNAGQSKTDGSNASKSNAVESPGAASPDRAWDPNSFGGRR